MSKRVPPKRLYKYRSFSNLTLGMLVNDTVYFADPTTFNDPLDTKPTLDTDLPGAALEPVLAQLIEERTTAEMAAAARTIRYNGPRTLNHIARQSRKAAERLLADIRYNATNPEYEGPIQSSSCLANMYKRNCCGDTTVGSSPSPNGSIAR